MYSDLPASVHLTMYALKGVELNLKSIFHSNSSVTASSDLLPTIKYRPQDKRKEHSFQNTKYHKLYIKSYIVGTH